ncbi:HAD family hydrolase [Tessaracoccus oleiagri]|uniref:Beta-phosphoglucomutase n=1 Tax=Tessaracoccus oleiagri TaxID=686624 RepID=A0A1G9JCJ2_9ACTN|nr:beta-phosphoglucomutase family hydrolase [Tessaracoccus oleiagri]SDL35012.1 haloacid dehalogenase superfamily, subfamily IA, variant 3 with third motif having DD or ED/beta-phosphoglucomutase family hydrolase [Tessaracoccus oleiagri]
MDWSAYSAALFDLDGVITPTAEVHMRAWSEMFNAFLPPDQPRYTDDDYYQYVDGKPRYDGVRDFLQARGISLPEGLPSDDPVEPTVCGLGNAKNARFNEILTRDGVQPYPGSARLIEKLAAAGVGLAVVSSSKNAATVLKAARLDQYFPVVVDGLRSAEEQLLGKPEPDTFLRAAGLLDAPASRCVVLEDAISGVQAGAAGEFGLVVGVDRGAGESALREAGADLVVQDLEELL